MNDREYIHPLPQHLFGNSTNPGSPNVHHSTGQSSPSQSPAPSPASLGYHSLYGNALPRFQVQMNLGPKISQQTSLNHTSFPHSLNVLSQNSQAVSGALNSPVTIGSSQSSQSLDVQLVSTPNTPHYQKQLSYAQVSRQSSSPHHHARSAAALARQSNTAGSTAVTITDPNNPNKPLNGLPAAEKKNKDINRIFGEGPPVAKEVPKDDDGWYTLDMGGMGLKNISRNLFQYQFLTTLFINHNNLTYLHPEISLLVNLRVLDASGNKLTVVPPELGLLVQLRDLLLFDNGISTLPPELGTLYQLETLGLEGNPINESIRQVLQEDGSAPVIAYLRDSCPVPLPPPERDWILIEGDPADDPKDKFTVLSYNILCERCATPQMYGYTPSWALAWEYRRELILQEVLSYNADVVCLQEVEVSQYEEFFRDELHRKGDYESVFWPKTRAKTMGEKERRAVDGCATFFKASRLTLVEKHLLEFNHIALQRPDFKKTEDIFNRVMTKDNIATLVYLENKETGARFIVGNTHIHWDPSFADVKLVQVAMYMDETEKMANKWKDIPPTPQADPNAQVYTYDSTTKIPTLICGDFNSIPSSGVYEFLSKGTIRQDHDDFGNHIYGAYTTDGLLHKLTLKSAYSHIDLPFTNFTPNFQGVIDYIFYTTPTLSVTALLGPMDQEYLSKIVGFPNAHFPSDHVCILAEFKLRALRANPMRSDFGSEEDSNSSNSATSHMTSTIFGSNGNKKSVQGVLGKK